MSNPILEMLNQRSPAMINITQMLNMVRASQNPESAIQQMVQSNPQMQQVMNFIKQNGGNPKDAFYTLAKQKGVNPDDILRQLQ